MESGLIIELVYQALRMAALLAGPTLLALLVVGLVLGILQAATSVNESTVAGNTCTLCGLHSRVIRPHS
jgi:flagellar biosynthetic protein FliQ